MDSVPATVALLVMATGCSSAPTAAKGKGSSHPAPPGATQPAANGSGTTPGSGRQAGAIPVGPGPQTKYTVQAQPAPGTCKYRFTAAKEPLPAPVCTRGATNPAVTQATLKTTICMPGYTATIRPPSSITAKEKAASILAYAGVSNKRRIC
ncbi:hypothetical protein C8250_041875 [Streptomyces sp. So13.3]|uniref:hypothetical protein n=1 Tax=Streptomyces TaxID=1883 RepID=UPI0011075284|nr:MULTISPECIES: hypothetical protein [Streptomyces]MCZ4102132.1 hypothetical protein [Streptomyces sp. H39-C1]QNA77487.1 hypothetical protein C8250_041875 [Streptomyces sp. So13.3]